VSLVFAGIDGGQSSTVAVIGDERGRILARGRAGPADEVGADASSTRLREALRGALDDARRGAGLLEGSDFAAIVGGISGYDGRVYGAAPELPSARAVLLHDAPIAHAGALAGRAGVIAIAGTGSVVYATDETAAARTLGGWGFLFGDEGSAFGIARDALAAMMRAQDDGDASLAGETHAACEFFGVPSLRALTRAFYSGELARDRLAAFAPAAMCSPRFGPLVDRGAGRLAELVCAAITAGAPPIVALVGGVFDDESFAARVRAHVGAGVTGTQFVSPRYEPAEGALLLAYREGGLDVRELLS